VSDGFVGALGSDALTGETRRLEVYGVTLSPRIPVTATPLVVPISEETGTSS
jgi:hypothetical protein